MSKSRAPLSLTRTTELLRGGGADPGEDDPALAAFLTKRDRLGALPVCWVSYRRAAYVGGERSLVRVTFDSDIVVAAPTADLCEPSRWTPVGFSGRDVVLELKYTGSYPAWLGEVVRRFGLHRSSMSKYRRGMDSLMAQAPRRTA